MVKLKTIFLIMGCIGVLLSIAIGIFILSKVYINPVDYWIHYPIDPILAVLYLAAIVFVISTFLIKKGKLLITNLFVILCLMIVFPSLWGGLWLIFLIGFWFLLAAIGLGRLMFNFILPNYEFNIVDRIFLSAVLGLGMFAMIVFGMGIFKLLTTTWAFIILVLISFVSFPGLFKEIYRIYLQARGTFWDKFKTADLRLPTLALGIILICIFGAYIWALAPAIRWDSLSYHIAAPEIYIQNKAIVEIPESYNTYWAHYAEMIYTFALLLVGQPLPGMLHFLAGVVTTGLTYLIGKRVLGTQVGLIAATLFISIPFVGFEIGTTYVDLFISMFALASLYAGIIWMQSGQIKWLVIIGLFSGFALGVKINAVLFIIPCWIFLFVVYIYKYRSLHLVLKYLIYLVVPAVLVYSPWPVRDYLWTGNPIFPMYNTLFHSPKWFTERSLWYLQRPSKEILASFIRLPWDMVVNSRSFYHEGPGGMIGALPLLALPWLYWHPSLEKQARFYGLILATYTLIVASIFSTVSVNARYLISLFPIAAVLGALNFQVLVLNCKRHNSVILRNFQLFFVLLFSCYIFGTRLALIMRIAEFPDRYPYKVVFGMETTESFLNRTIPIYSIFEYINEHNPDAKVLSIGNEFRLYTTAHIYGLLFSPQTRLKLESLKNEIDLAHYLEEEKFGYILLYPAEQRARPLIYDVKSMSPKFFLNYTELVFVHNNIRLYKFYPNGTIQQKIALNDLKNPGFEEDFEDGYLKGWSQQGFPKLITNKSYVHSGRASLEIYGANSPNGYSYVYQEIPVHSGEVYTAGYWVRGFQGSSLQLQIEWFDKNKKPIDIIYDWAGLNNEWQFFDLIAYAPDQVAYAKFYASITGSGSAWIDDLCFTQSDHCP